jgi:hypothetical protein
VLQELDKIELNEDQICENFVVLGRTKSWKEIKFFKADIRKNRRNFIKDGNNVYPRGQAQGPPPGDMTGKNYSRQNFNRNQMPPLPEKGTLGGRMPVQEEHWWGHCFCILQCQGRHIEVNFHLPNYK